MVTYRMFKRSNNDALGFGKLLHVFSWNFPAFLRSHYTWFKGKRLRCPPFDKFRTHKKSFCWLSYKKRNFRIEYCWIFWVNFLGAQTGILALKLPWRRHCFHKVSSSCTWFSINKYLFNPLLRNVVKWSDTL